MGGLFLPGCDPATTIGSPGWWVRATRGSDPPMSVVLLLSSSSSKVMLVSHHRKRRTQVSFCGSSEVQEVVLTSRLTSRGLSVFGEGGRRAAAS